MPRIKIDGFPIGCPAAHGEGNCPFCGGGWPGTKSPSAVLIQAAKKGKLNPDKLGCGTLTEQGKFLIAHFGQNRKGVKQMTPEPLTTTLNGKKLEDHYQILVNPKFVSALLAGEEEELGVGPVNAILPTNEWFAVEKRGGILASDFPDGG